MGLERLLSIHVAVLAVLATSLLGMGQQDVSLPLLVIVVAITSVYFTDLKRWFVLNHVAANFAALLAVAISLFDFSASDRNHQLLAIANLLVYLQIVVLFQEKTIRIYWQLLMLSLLQVVVAAALNYSVLFGMLLLIYMGAGLVTLVLFFFYREEKRYQRPVAAPADPSVEAKVQDTAVKASPAAAGMQFTGSRVDVAAVATGRCLARVALCMGVLTVALTVFVFFAVPRGFGRDTPWHAVASSPQRVVGFSQEVTLGALGHAIESPETVMRLELVDESTGESFRLNDTLLLRGSVVTHYGYNQWRIDDGGTEREARVDLPRARQTTRDLVRQKIQLEPLNEPVVFSVYPPLAMGPGKLIEYDLNRQQLVRDERRMDTQLNFDLGTTGIRNRRLFPITPARDFTRDERRRLLQLPGNPDDSDPLAGLKATAAKVVEDALVAEGDPMLTAQALESFLKNTGGFTYSLLPRSATELDYIEDFVMNNRSGHCEYFASALTLMLRSQGVPARMVIGYKGGEWNNLGRFYQIRQLHAHAWVEAYLSAGYLADRKVDLGPDSRGGWLRLDPTADDPEGLIQDPTGLWARLMQTFDYVEMLWISHIVGLSYQQQQSNIYQPLGEALAGALDKMAGRQSESTSLWSKIAERGKAALAWLRGNWFSWRGGLVAMAFCLAGTGIYRLTRFAWRGLAPLWAVRRGTAAGGEGRRVEFYRRLEALLARYGVSRPASQTQREFATVAGGQLAEKPDLRSVAPLPRGIVEAFYAVRFGHRALEPQREAEVEAALHELEERLRR